MANQRTIQLVPYTKEQFPYVKFLNNIPVEDLYKYSSADVYTENGVPTKVGNDYFINKNEEPLKPVELPEAIVSAPAKLTDAQYKNYLLNSENFSNSGHAVGLNQDLQLPLFAYDNGMYKRNVPYDIYRRYVDTDNKSRAFNEQVDTVFGEALGISATTLLGPTALMNTATGYLGGTAFDKLSERYTGKTIGDNIADYFNVPEHSFTRTFITPMANPGYLLYPKLNNILLNRAKYNNFLHNTLVQTPKISQSLRNGINDLPLKQGTKNVMSDVIFKPFSTINARLRGEYPLTVAERRNYIKARRRAIEEGLKFNYDKYLKIPMKQRQAQFEQPIIKDVSYNLAKNFNDIDTGVFGSFDPFQNQILFVRRHPNSNLPLISMKRGINSLKGTAAHEGYHWLMQQKPYNAHDKALTERVFELQYDGINEDNLNLMESPFKLNLKRQNDYIQQIYENTYDSNIVYKIWQNSPEEFAAEKASLDAQNFNPTISKLKLSKKFDIPYDEASLKYTWLNNKGYAKGGKLHKNYRDWSTKLSKLWNNQDLSKDDYNYQKYYNDDPERAYRQLDAIKKGNAPHFDDSGKSGMYKTLNHPTYPDFGENNSWFDNDRIFRISNRQMDNSDRTLDYLGRDLDYNNGGTKVVYNGGYVLPTVTVTPNENYTELVPNILHTGFVYEDSPVRAKALGGIINKNNPIQNYANNPHQNIPAVRYDLGGILNGYKNYFVEGGVKQENPLDNLTPEQLNENAQRVKVMEDSLNYDLAQKKRAIVEQAYNDNLIDDYNMTYEDLKRKLPKYSPRMNYTYASPNEINGLLKNANKSLQFYDSDYSKPDISEEVNYNSTIPRAFTTLENGMFLSADDLRQLGLTNNYIGDNKELGFMLPEAVVSTAMPEHLKSQEGNVGIQNGNLNGTSLYGDKAVSSYDNSNNSNGYNFYIPFNYNIDNSRLNDVVMGSEYTQPNFYTPYNIIPIPPANAVATADDMGNLFTNYNPYNYLLNQMLAEINPFKKQKEEVNNLFRV